MNEPRPNPFRRGTERAASTAAPTSTSAAELEALLAELLPSLRQVEHDLEIDGVPAADLVAESQGRLVLVLWIDGEGDAPALAALDALATARREGPLLARHLGLAHAAQRDPLVVLVAERYSEVLRERLLSLPAAQLLLLELRTLRTGRREQRLLVPLAAAAHAADPHAEPAGDGVVELFLGTLPAPAACLGSDLVERISRIDPELLLEGGPEGIAWSFHGQPLCSLLGREGRLEGRLSGSSVPHGIHSPGTVDTFLEWVLSCHLELLEGLPRFEGLGEVELIPSAREPLLTPEEIDAFRG